MVWDFPLTDVKRGTGWHIMPVVEIDKNNVKTDNMNDIEPFRFFTRKELEEAHDNFHGGDDILMLL